MVRYLMACQAAVLAAATAVAVGQWQTGPEFPASASGREFAIGLCKEGVLYALGGTPWTNGGDEDGSVHTLAPFAGAWQEEIPLKGVGPFIRQGGGVDALGRIVIFGGFNPGDPGGRPPDPFVYDTLDGPGDSLAPRGAAAPDDYFAWCTDDQGRVYSIGGGPGPEATPNDPNTGYAERYLGAGDLWEPIAPMPTPAADACAVFDGAGRILVMGGYDRHATVRLRNVAAYDIASKVWSDDAVPDLPMGLTGARAVLGADGRVYLLGGESGPVGAGTIGATCYVLDLAGNVWSEGPAMAEARVWFGAALGEDDCIYVMGGVTPAGGTDGCEKLYTTPCPVFTRQPEDTAAWRDQTVAFATAVTAGGTVDFQWFRDGQALSDGPTGAGSTIRGARGETLVIESVGTADEGAYWLKATNSCGSTESTHVALSARVPPPLPRSWTVTNLHPAWAVGGSWAVAVEAGEQVGYGARPVQDWSSIERPTIWRGSAASAVDITPAGSVGGAVEGTNGATQAGWWWWPYQCWIGGEWQTCFSRQAARWHGDAASHENLQASGWEYSRAGAIDNDRIGGSITNHDGSGNQWYHAALWHADGPTGYADIHPSSARSSAINAVDGDRQFGSVVTQGFSVHAAAWTGSGSSFQDLHPAGASRSWISGAGDGQQVGTAEFGGELHGVLWNGSPESAAALTPLGGISSSATDCEGGLQIGSVVFADGGRPVVWAGLAEEFADLGGFLPPEIRGAALTGIDVQPDGTIVVVGYGHNASLGISNALMWTSAAACAADFNGDGLVDTRDVLAFLNVWTAGGAGADFNGDGIVDTRDVLAFLNAWTAGC